MLDSKESLTEANMRAILSDILSTGLGMQEIDAISILYAAPPPPKDKFPWGLPEITPWEAPNIPVYPYVPVPNIPNIPIVPATPETIPSDRIEIPKILEEDTAEKLGGAIQLIKTIQELLKHGDAKTAQKLIRDFLKESKKD